MLAKTKTVVSVIGMLHPGALSQKKWKKAPFLLFFKLLLKRKKMVFHASDESEQDHIKHVLGLSVEVKVAGCFPNIFNYKEPLPRDEKAIFGSIALISPMKNHHLVLDALKTCTSEIEYRIFGPVKDAAYWHQCEQIIKSLPSNITVKYVGEVTPAVVPEELAGIHYFILPSKSENFGYAFIEALSVGRPVITSYFTPWDKLEEAKAGLNVDISNLSDLRDAIEHCCRQHDEVYKEWSRSSHSYAISHVDFASLQKQYADLYSA